MGKEPLNTTCTPAMRENTNDCSWPIRDCCEGLLATLNRQSSAGEQRYPPVINHMGVAMSNIAVPCAAVAAFTP
jgi:hypothetical protein